VLLWGIWILAVIIASFSVAIMACLVLVRIATDILRRRRAARRTAVLNHVFAWLEGGISDEEAEQVFRESRAVSTGLLIEIFELMRGEDQRRLADLAERAGVPQYLRDSIEVGNAAERLTAAESLVWFPSPETLAVLRFALHDRDDQVALAAAASLAELGEDLPVARLLEARLGHLGDSSKRLEAVLIRIAPRQVDDLLSVAQDSIAPDRVRAAAIDALSRTGLFELMAPIAALADAPSPIVRASVARSLGILGHPGAYDAIVRLLGDSSWEVRAEAAEATGKIGLDDAAQLLADLLNDDNWWVRFRAGEALASLGETGIARLRMIAQSRKDVSRRMAALVLAERGLV